MTKRIVISIVLLLFFSGCATYTLVDAGPQQVGGILVTPQSNWNKSPINFGPKTTVWTKDGQALNQLIFFDGIENGKPLMKSLSKEIPMPTFQADMLPNEIAELVETTMRNIQGGSVDTSVSNLRPQMVNGLMSTRFDLQYYRFDGLAKAGEVIALIKNDKLYLVIFDAAELHYRRKDSPEVEAIFINIKI